MTLPCVVIDTNVLMVAEEAHPGASDACVAACVHLVSRLDNGLAVAVDMGDEIVREYLGTLRSTPSSGLGTKLAKRLWDRRWDTAICRRVAITPIDTPPSYEEVPAALRDFDADDQMFIAVAAAEASRPQIHTAVDREWWQRRHDFVGCGIDVQFACAADLLD